jgi:hypothetical protein
MGESDDEAASAPNSPPLRPLLVVVEGANDLEFLVRLSSRLQGELPDVPNLSLLCRSGRVVLVPLGGGAPDTWPDRLAGLRCPEFHLYDREQHPETNERIRAVDRVNAREGCHAVLTSKRSLENYLHPQAITAAGGSEIEFGDHDPVARLLAQSRQRSVGPCHAWEALKFRAQRRLITNAKRWLNSVAIEEMTAALLYERDPAGEVLGWFQTIARLAEGSIAVPPE